ncbi:MAG: glycosyltransferase [Bacteroides sp. SM23_62_1]|nr:MAG: glycosyltransferase [Bacteroides sp. SM23_62_1]
MRIAVNTRLLLPGKLDGIGWFTYETLKRITRNHPEQEFIFLFDRPWHQEFIFSDNIRPVYISPPTRHPILWYTWFEYSVPSALIKYQADVFLSPDGYLSLKAEAPSLAVIHDINFHHRPEDLPYASRIYYRRFFPLYAQKADIIVTVSEYSKQDICSSYNIPVEKVNVIYNGANPIYSPLSQEEILKIREELTGRIPYFVFVGTLHPRKNIPRLLLAFDRFRQNISENFKMVIVGEKTFLTGDIEKALSQMNYNEDVIFTGRLDPEKLRMVMGGAVALTFLPLFEGFGIPIVEAMYCDTPVLASNVTSLPEVAGDAALYADPYNINAIAGKMLEIVKNDNLRKELIEKGKIQRQKYSWDKTAGGLWQNVERIM